MRCDPLLPKRDGKGSQGLLGRARDHLVPGALEGLRAALVVHQRVAAPEVQLVLVVAFEAGVGGLLGRARAREPGVEHPALALVVVAGDDREEVGLRLLDVEDDPGRDVAAGAVRERARLGGLHHRGVHQGRLPDHAPHVDRLEVERALRQFHLADRLAEQIRGLGVGLQVLDGVGQQVNGAAAGGRVLGLHRSLLGVVSPTSSLTNGVPNRIESQ